MYFFFFSSRRRHTRSLRDWSSDVCSSDLRLQVSQLHGASSDMDNVDPENLRNLQAVAKEYVSSMSDVLTQMCADLKEGRGSNMPGVGLAVGGEAGKQAGVKTLRAP